MNGVNMITCTTWVRKGVAAENPDQVKLTAEELEKVINDTKENLEDLEDEEEESDNDEPGTLNSSAKESSSTKNKNTESMEEDEYDFDKYDDEPDALYARVGDIAAASMDKKDPYITVPDEDDVDSEKEDDIIKPDDNLVLVGHVEGDASLLEVFVYNEEEGSFYCHHDILLSSIPICMEWLSFDPSEEKPGNLCAIGNMTPVIEVWDLDLVDSLEPAFKLGQKASKKKKTKGFGHSDSVLDIVWNENFTHILASASVDQTVLLWDLENGKPSTKLSPFEEKVQSIKWQPSDNSALLTGCADKFVRLFDCKYDDTYKSWQTGGEVEIVVWDHLRPHLCYIGTNVGSIECIDTRKDDEIVWQKTVDSKEITGLRISSACPGMLVSTVASGKMFAWDITDSSKCLENQVYEESFSLGTLNCLGANPDNPFVFAMGGDNRENNLKVVNLSLKTSVNERFKEFITPTAKAEPMEIANGMENLEVNSKRKKK